MNAKPMLDSSVPIDWIDSPSTDTGLFVADEVDGWQYVSYADLAALSRRMGGALRAHGLSAGDNACIVMPTGHHCVAAIYAVWLCGATVTLIAPPTFGEDAAYVDTVGAILRCADPRTVVTSPELFTTVDKAARVAGLSRQPLPLTAALADAAQPIHRTDELAECALLQFTSGSTGTPRGVMVSWVNLAGNLRSITSTIGWRPGDAGVSWLPLYHDMGLIGLLMGIANQGSVHLMRPDQFIRDPMRWIRAMSRAHHTGSPSFGLDYAARRLSPDDVAGVDLTSWRSLITGAEPVDLNALHAFCRLLKPAGFNPTALIAAYGLAEATLLVTGTRVDEPISAIRIDKSSLRMGQRVAVLDQARFGGLPLPGTGWIAGLGSPGTEVSVIDADGATLPDGTLGQIVVSSPSVAMGYRGDGSNRGTSTRFAGAGVLHTGDAGFCYGGEVFVLGRMGSALKIRGKTVFMEDVETRLAAETGIPRGKFCAVAHSGVGLPGIALFVETCAGSWVETARRVLRTDLGTAPALRIVVGPRGFIRRTTSGKPRREKMWALLVAGELTEGTVIDAAPVTTDTERTGPAAPKGHRLANIRELLAKTLESVAIDDDVTILLEGSLAEGFGNDESDVDFLAVVPGDASTPTMPTVLFVDGRRTELRTRSIGQLRGQLEAARTVFTDPQANLLDRPGNDTLNRCQRFLRAAVVRPGRETDQILQVQSSVPYSDFTDWMCRWWLSRARQSLRQAVAFEAVGARADARAWARDGLQQAAKGWIAGRGEAYLETKWLTLQMDRSGEFAAAARYRELDTALAKVGAGGTVDLVDEAIAAAGEFGVTDVANDPAAVMFARAPGVTTWPIGQVLHVIRGDQDVFALTGEAATAWRTIVFSRPITEAVAHCGHPSLLAEFVRLGLVLLRWRNEADIRPAIAMCEPAQPYTCPPCTRTPPVSVGGATFDRPVVLSPLTARRFVECGGNLIWANVVVENAREDLLGAVKAGQAGVADVAAMRLIGASIRVLASAFGCSPMPADVAFTSTVERVVPPGTAGRDELLGALRQALQVSFADLKNSAHRIPALLTQLDELVNRIRTITQSPFPPSFDSREQWRETLELSYQWLRLAGYLDADLPLDEARDLLTAGGNQPHARSAK
jgi:acyl-CoA synthetase (AMP-forming)/AMP-acid ligase II